MRKLAKLIRLLCFSGLIGFSISGFGQDPILNFDENDPLNFLLKIPPTHFQDLTPFHYPQDTIPFFQPFIIYGDGNYQLVDDKRITKSDYDHKFFHSYYYQSSYPAISLLLERKTDIPPPKSGLQVPPKDIISGTSPGIVNITIGATPGPITNTKITLNPNNPILETPFSNRVGMDFSHKEDTSFYVEKNKIVALPIAYKPINDSHSECLVFYFDDTPNNGVNEFTPFQVYGSSYNGSDVTLPSPPPASLKSNIPDFERMIIHEVSVTEGRYQNNSDPLNITELRWFPLLNSSDSLVARNYRFLAILYGAEPTGNNEIYDFKEKMLNSCESLPKEIVVGDDSTTTTYHFIDSDLIEAFHHEPDDPNKLVITDICKCDDDEHIITFNLKYCNQAKIGVATGATIVINDIYDVFSCLEPDQLSPASNTNCIKDKTCHRCCEDASGEILDEDYRFCSRILNQDDYLIGDHCGNLTFSAKIKTSDLHLIYEKSLLEYCVRLHSTRCNLEEDNINACKLDPTFTEEDSLYGIFLTNHPDNTSGFQYPSTLFNPVKEVCGTNCLLDTLLLFDTILVTEMDPNSSDTILLSKLIPNPIWSDEGDNTTARNKGCEDCKNCCKKFSCRPFEIIGLGALAVAAIAGLTTLIIRRRRRQNTTQT